MSPINLNLHLLQLLTSVYSYKENNHNFTFYEILVLLACVKLTAMQGVLGGCQCVTMWLLACSRLVVTVAMRLLGHFG